MSCVDVCILLLPFASKSARPKALNYILTHYPHAKSHVHMMLFLVTVLNLALIYVDILLSVNSAIINNNLIS